MFGDRASPYLTHYVVLQHAEDNIDKYPLAVAIILLQMYMDDIMTSLETDNEAIKAGHQFRELLVGKAHFKIRCWCSNRSEVLRDVPVEDRMANVNIEESELPRMKALGVQWNAEMDMFTFKLNPRRDVYTKRGFLKKLAMLFDPLHMLTPFTIRARMAMQETWLLGFWLG